MIVDSIIQAFDAIKRQTKYGRWSSWNECCVCHKYAMCAHFDKNFQRLECFKQDGHWVCPTCEKQTPPILRNIRSKRLEELPLFINEENTFAKILMKERFERGK